MREPSHFFPDSSTGITLVVVVHSAGLLIPPYLMSWVVSTLPWMIGSIALGLTDLVLTVSLVATYRHYRYVRPHQREAAHHCPECDYDIGEEMMEQGCPECGWQIEPL